MERENSLSIPDVISKRKISEEEKKQLQEKGKTDEILKDFYSDPKQSMFDAYLVVKKGKIMFDKIEYHNERNTNKSVSKSQAQDTYQVPKKVFGVYLTEEQRKTLRKPDTETELIKGFKKRDKETNKVMEFDAHLSITKDKNEKYNLNFKYLELEKKQELDKQKSNDQTKNVAKKRGMEL